MNKAESWGVPPDTVDKDWVLGHVIYSLFSLKKIRKNLLFKGGTALRKCYFPEYRFSEDLDFTTINSEFSFTMSDLNSIIEDCRHRSGILFHPGEIEPLRFNDKLMGFQTRLKFWGANHSKNQIPPAPERWTTGIKIEITLHEKVYFLPNFRKISHDYSDRWSEEIDIPCYDLKEIMAEKLRSLIQRSYTAPRDYYDVYSLIHEFSRDDWLQIKSAFIEKMEFKGLTFSGVNQFFIPENLKKAKSAWKNSLMYQVGIKNLPDFDMVIEHLKEILKTNF
ncbi:MAG: nucleotidyl transferase AbiEii/AbiGii toxin family protein [Calditrichia bacterium]